LHDAERVADAGCEHGKRNCQIVRTETRGVVEENDARERAPDREPLETRRPLAEEKRAPEEHLERVVQAEEEPDLGGVEIEEPDVVAASVDRIASEI